MLTVLNPDQHHLLRPLYSNFGLRLHGLVEAAFSGEFGRAWVDDPANPSVGLVHIDFWLVGGDPIAPLADDALRIVPQGAIVTDGSQAWPAMVRSQLAGRIVERTRTGFATPPPDAWDRERLQAMATRLPDGFSIRKIDRSNLASFLVVAEDFASNWRDLDAYLERGIGFGVFDATHCVAGCSSFTLAGGKLEIEIDTDPAYRRLGLARAVAAHMILHCLDNGIEPCWDAHNPESAALAQQLGFTNPYPYTVFVVA